MTARFYLQDQRIHIYNDAGDDCTAHGVKVESMWMYRVEDLARACGFALVPLEANVPTGFACGAGVVDEIRKILSSPVPKPCPVEALAARYDVEVLEYPASAEKVPFVETLTKEEFDRRYAFISPPWPFPTKPDPERELQEMRAQTRRSIAMGPL